MLLKNGASTLKSAPHLYTVFQTLPRGWQPNIG